MSDILTGFNMQGNDPIDDRIVSKSILETLEEYLKRVPVQKRYYGLTFFALDKDNKLRQYTFQTSLIEPTIDDSDDRLDKLQENIDNVDKDLQDHKNDKSIHKTSEEIRSEIVDADIPDSIARAQWVIQSIGVAIENIIAGASTDYDTLKKVQTKIEDLRSEMESQLYGDDGSGIFKTLEQVLDFLNEYKDFIIDIPNNFVSKHDIIDNLTTDDAAKVLSARQGKILSETLTNYFDSAMQSIRSETDRATNAENRIEAKLDDEITRSTNKDENHDNRLTALESKSHTQNTDLGTTSSTFQLKYNTGNKIKHESDAISVRNSTDTDYVNFIAKNGTFKGDLLVEGKSFVTEAETVEIKDNLLLLNKGEVGSGVTKGMAGLEIDRGTEPNYQIVFDESDNRFKAGEIGDIQCLALRDGDDSMKDGMFTSWDSTTKRLKTTNIVPSNQSLFFGDSGEIGLKYASSNFGNILDSPIDSLEISKNAIRTLNISSSADYTFFYSNTAKGIYINNPILGRSFKRAVDLSEVLYHADLINNLTTGGTNKSLTAEQGKVLKSSIDGLNTEIGNVKDSYLPLSGGTMTGTLRLSNNISLASFLTDNTSINLARVSENNIVMLSTAEVTTRIYSNASDLTHFRGETGYPIHDTYNLPDPVRLGSDQTFTGDNTFTAGKFNVAGDKSKFSVNDIGGLRMYYDYADDDAGISRYIDFYTKTASDTDYTRRGIFGLYASKSTPNSDYAYIGAGDVGSEDAQYRFFPNTLFVPETFSLRTLSSKRQLIGVDNINNRARFGGPLIPTWIISNNTDLFHSKYTNKSTYSKYKIWDESNLPSPASTTDLSKYALLAGDNTFTGSNTFNKTVSVVGTGTISLNANTGINYKLVSTSAARSYSITLGTADDPHTTSFGSVLTNQEYAYIALPGTDYGNTPYKFFVDQMTVPNVFRLLTKEGVLLLRKDSNGVQLGSGSSNTFVNSSNSDLTHRKYTASSTYTDYKIWDASNLPSPASSTDLANYLPLSGGNMSGNIVLDNGILIQGKDKNGVSRVITGMASGSNIIYFGNVNSPVAISTTASDITHVRGTDNYKIYDSYNLPNPVQTSDLADYVVKSDLDAYATKAELGDYATKQWVTDNFSGGGSGSDLLPANNTWTGTNTYSKNVVLANNIKLISSKTDGTFVNLIQEDSSNNLIIGNGSPVRIYGEGNLAHYIGSSAYTVYDTFNLPNPVQTSDLESYATKTWVGEQGYLTNSSLSGYATQQWVKDQEYITGADIPPIVIANSGSGNAVTSITATGHALTVTKGATYLTQSSLAGYATEAWVTNKGYLTSSSLDGYAKTTDLASYLPLAGGTMTGAINFSSSQILTLENKPLVAYDSTSNYVNIGGYSLNSRLFFLTSQTDLQHYRKNDGELAGTSYKIWDAYNVSRPLDYVNGTAGSVTSVYTRNLNLNGTNYPFIGTGTSVVTLFAPTTAGTSGQVLQSQGAGKAPIWVDGGTGGGVQLSDTNVWTGLNTFQGGLKTSDGTNSYDVWDKNNLKYVARITPSNLGYALSFYTTTAGWRDFDDLCINNLMPNASKTIEQGGAGFVGQYESAYASAEIKDIVTQNIFASGGKNLSNVSTGASLLGNETNAFKSAHIGEVNTNTVKSADGKSLLNFKTDGVYMIANSGTEYKLATLNDISGGGSSVSLDGNNTWTGVNIFSGTGLVTNQYDSGNTEIPATANYSIRLACSGSYNNYGFGAVKSDEIQNKKSYAFIQTPSAFFTFDNSGSLYTTIGNTKYEFWNKQNLAKPIIYNTNSDGDGVLYKGDSTSNRIDSLELVGILPPTNNAVTLSNGGTGGFGNVNNAYAEAYIGNVHANNVTTTTIVVPGSENYFEFKEDGLYFWDIINQKKYKLTMQDVS